MHNIYESYIEFCNEAKDKRTVLYKFTFSDKWVNKDDKSPSPVWVLANDKEWNVIKKNAAIEMSGEYGYKNSEEDALKTMKYEKEKKDDSSAGGSLTPINKVVEIIKGLHKVSKVKEDINNFTNESKAAEAIMDLLEKWYKKPGNKNILKTIMGLTGIDDKKILENLLKRNVDAASAFNSIMALEKCSWNE
jgi:hypothetical protein